MPKLTKKQSQFKIEIDYRLSKGPYDGAYIFHDGYKIGQLTLIRCEQSRELLQLLKRADIQVEVGKDFHAKEKVSQPTIKAATKVATKSGARR